jgi:hypothetical protein
VQKESLRFAATLLTCFCWIEGAGGEAVVVGLQCPSVFDFRTDCEEAKFCSMGYYLATLFRWNNSWNYLWDYVEMTPQSNSDTTGLRLINNMASPHI